MDGVRDQAGPTHVDNAIRHVKGSSHRVRSDLSATLFLTPPEDYDGGVLTLQIPVAEKAKPRKISITTKGEDRQIINA